MEIKHYLNAIGFSDKEIEVYLTLLKNGPQPVRKIAQQSGVNRGTTYDILKDLIASGLASYVHKEKHQYFIAEDPEALKNMVADRARKADELKQGLKEAVPVLRSMVDRAGRKPVARYYEAVQGLRTILTDVLEVCAHGGKEYVAYSAAELRSPLYAAYPHFTDERIARHIHVRVIAVGEGGFLKGLDERRWLSRDAEHVVPTYTMIYGNKVALISVSKDGEPLGLIIEDKGITATQKFIFDWVWKQLGSKSDTVSLSRRASETK